MLSGPESSTDPHILLYPRAVRIGYISHTRIYTRYLQRTFSSTTATAREAKLTRHTFLPISIWGAPELESQDMPQNSLLQSKKQSRSALNTPSTMTSRRD